MSKKQKKRTVKKRQPRQKAFPLWMLFTLVLATILAFSPSIQNEFVNWDDDRNLYENEEVLNLNAENLATLFTSNVIGNYNPLSNLVLGIQHKVFNGSKHYHALFHGTNILLHLLCVWLLFKIILAMGLSPSIAFGTALLFAIHPMRVESVTWITEIKDVLYASFFFGSLYAYIKYIKTDIRKWWLIALLLFTIGLFAKIQMVTLPLTLLLVDYWFDRPYLIKSALKKWPFFLLALLFGLYGVVILGSEGSLDTETTYRGFERIFIGSYSLCIYLIKSVAPYRMSPLYPYPLALSIWHYLSIVPFLAYLGLMFWSWKRSNKMLFFGSAFFFVNIVFMLQILGAGQGYLADRFTYVAFTGLFLIYTHYLLLLIKVPRFKLPAQALAILVPLAFAYMTFEQTKIWKNSATLWTHVIKYYPNSTLPFGNRANYYRDLGDIDRALEDYSATIRLDPRKAGPYNSRAKLYFGKNQDALALQDYNKAIELEPDNAEYLINRGAALAKLQRWDEALRDMNKGIEISPQNSNGYLNRSLVYQHINRLDLSLADLKKYQTLKPADANMWYESARIYYSMNQLDNALQDYNESIRLDPNQGLFYLERSKVFLRMNQINDCVRDIRQASKLGKPPIGQYAETLKRNNIQY